MTKMKMGDLAYSVSISACDICELARIAKQVLDSSIEGKIRALDTLTRNIYQLATSVSDKATKLLLACQS